MAGHRVDADKVKEWYGENGRISECDIDPSFPGQGLTDPIVPAKVGSVAVPLREWLALRTPPDIEHLLERQEVNGRPGDWVLLSGYYNQRDVEQGVGVFCHVVGVLIAESDMPRISQHLKDGHSYDSNDLSLPSLHYTFVGEAGWSDTYPPLGHAEWKFVVGTREREMARLEMFENDSQSTEEPSMITWNENIYDTVEVTIPVIENGWESYHTCTNAGGCPPLIGRQICEELGLLVDQQTSEFRDQIGKLASAVVVCHNDDSAAQELVYLRKDLVAKLLAQRGARLVWSIWGERELVSGNMGYLSDLYKKHGTPERFEAVRQFPGGKPL